MAKSEQVEHVIAISVSGTADEEELDNAIAEAWRAALSDGRERAEIAYTLGVQETELDPANPPFEAHIRGAGVFGAEILIGIAVGFGIGVAKGFAEEEGSSAGKAAAKALNRIWIEHIRNRVSPPGSAKLGPEKDDPEQT